MTGTIHVLGGLPKIWLRMLSAICRISSEKCTVSSANKTSRSFPYSDGYKHITQVQSVCYSCRSKSLLAFNREVSSVSLCFLLSEEKLLSQKYCSVGHRPVYPCTYALCGYCTSTEEIDKSVSADKGEITGSAEMVVTNLSELPLLMTEEQAKELLQNLSEEDKKRLDVLKLKFEIDQYMHSEEDQLANVTDKDWLILLSLNGENSRRKYLRRQLQRQKRLENKQAQKQERQEEGKVYQSRDDEGTQGFQGFIDKNLTPVREKRWKNHKIVQSMILGESSPVVFDMAGYNSLNIIQRENTRLIVQQVYYFNRSLVQPWILVFCNVSELLQREVFDKMQIFAYVTENPVTDLYSKDRLILYTPDCQTKQIHKLNFDDILVVNGCFEKRSCRSLQVEPGLRYGCLPVQKYLFKKSAGGIPTDLTVKVLFNFKQTEDWHQAFQELPAGFWKNYHGNSGQSH